MKAAGCDKPEKPSMYSRNVLSMNSEPGAILNTENMILRRHSGPCSQELTCQWEADGKEVKE